MKSIGLMIREQFAAGDAKRDAGNLIPEDVERFTDILYGTDPAWQSLDVYRPKDVDGKLPVIISYHGGGWCYGDKEGYQWYTMSLAQRGFAVINYTYRLAPEFKFPSPLEDMNLVITWMYENAEKYGFDLENVFGVGDSAGGNGLALYSCITSNEEFASHFDFKVPNHFTFNAVALNCGAYTVDISDEKGMNYGLMQEYLTSMDDIDLVNVPGHVTEKFPPAFVMTAEQDFLKNDVNNLIPVLVEKNVPYALRYFTGPKDAPLGHVFHCNIKLKEAKLCNDEECNFFKSYMK